MGGIFSPFGVFFFPYVRFYQTKRELSPNKGAPALAVLKKKYRETSIDIDRLNVWSIEALKMIDI